MAFLDPIFKRLALAMQKRGFMPGPGGVGWMSGGPWHDNSQQDFETLEKAFIVNPFVNRCINVIADTFADLPIKVYREVQTKAGTEREEIADHPLAELLWAPAPRMSASYFKKSIASALALDGEAIIFAENGSGGKDLRPVEIKRLQILKSRFVKEVKFTQAGLVKSYVYRQSGGEIEIPAEFITHPKNVNPDDDGRGLSAIKVLQNPVLLKYYQDKHNINTFERGTIPPMALVYQGESALTEAQRKANQEAWKKKYSGIANAGEVPILDLFKIETFGVTAKDGEFVKLGEATRGDILCVLGVPPILAAVFEFANYANSSQQLRLFYEYTIQPMATIICDAFNSQLLPVWFGNEKGLYIEPDYSEVEVLQDDKEIRARVHQIYVQSGVMTPNEVRDDLALPPMDGADELRAPAANPLDGLLGIGGRKTKATLPPSRLDQWKSFDRDLRIREESMRKVMARFFVDQGKRLAANLTGLGVLAGISPTHYTVESEMTIGTVRQVDQGDLFKIFNQELEDAELRRVMSPVIESVIEEFGRDALSLISGGVAFNAQDPRISAYLSQKIMRLARINRTTEDILRELLVGSAADNATVAETARRIRDTFDFMGQGDEFQQARAETVARTETASAGNFAQMEGFRQSGVVKAKEWLSSRDAFVRDTHAMLDSEQVPLDQPFSNGLMAPAIDGPPEEVINCRCTVLPVLED